MKNKHLRFIIGLFVIPIMNLYNRAFNKLRIMNEEISVRDYFASKVLQGIYANNEMWVNMCIDKRNYTRDKANDSQEDYVAQQCYKMSDAMIKERSRYVKPTNRQGNDTKRRTKNGSN